ncbi:hypothetical protein [Sneathia sanguinegens]|uniref:hypothetical protein n=1 Tax=Sneathia sanguinegens TaxID=40543 RepID=UPI00082AF4F5|nr:hypothetical protein [Sneathia sanguinegens]
MKKSLLLTALIASVASLAATTGTVELEVKNEMKAEKVNEVLTENKTSAKLKSEVKVANSGFSFGTELGLKELTLFKLGKKDSTQFEGFKTLKEKNDGSKVWAKYEFPELKGFHSSVKAEYNIPEKIKAELDANYEIKNKATLGYNTTHELKLGGTEKVEGKSITSTQKVYLNVTNPKFVDSKLEAEVKHDWQFEKKEVTKDKKKFTYYEPEFFKSVKDIRGEAKLNYKVLNNLVLGGEAYVKYINFIDGNDKGKYKDFLIGKDDAEFAEGVKHTGTGAVALNLTYEKDKLKLENKVFLQNIFELQDDTITRNNFGMIDINSISTDANNPTSFETLLKFHYGTNIKATYTAIDKLTLTADTTFGGTSSNIDIKTTLTKKDNKIERKLEKNNSDHLDKDGKTNETNHTLHAGYVKVALGAKYDYELIDAVTLTPELNVKVEATELKSPLAKKRSQHEFKTNGVDNTNYNFVSLEITPKLSVAYKPISKFTVSANAELPITLDNKKNDKRDKFEFRNVQIKPSVNVKYEW